MRHIFLSGLALFLFSAAVDAQHAHFPLQTGDTWQYFQILFPDPNHPFVDVQQTTVIGDTLMPNGHRYSVVSGWWWYGACLRQAGDSVFRWTPYGEVLQFDFSSAPGDSIFSTAGQLHDTVIVHTWTRDTISTWGILSFTPPRRAWSFGLDNPLFVDDEQWIHVIDSLGITDMNAMIGPYSFKGARINGSVYGNLTSVEPPVTMVPDNFVLAQNYPNPFNPSTTIKFELPKASHVTLTVYDILGREVDVLVSERRDAGVHEVKFDGSNLASGVYFYRLNAGALLQTRKLCVVK